MSENTAIAWAHDTFNPWEGCQKVGPGCDNCYAEARNARYGGGVAANWGPGAPRRRTSPANWAKPVKWDREAAASGAPRRVFCASLADVFDNAAPKEWRADLAALILRTPHLTWMLLTKRIGNAGDMLSEMFPESVPANVWIGMTVVNQKEADRDWDHLNRIKHCYGVSRVFLSIEPMLAPIDLSIFAGWLDWVIVGGESGPQARPIHPDWARQVRDFCALHGIAFFFKQWGEFRPADEQELPDSFGPACDAFRVMCRNGFVGDLSLESAFLHKARKWPACFAANPSEADCNCLNLRRVGTKQSGDLLDGAQHHNWPEGVCA